MSSVCVHGSGDIGQPPATMLADSGHDVAGYDASPEVVETLQEGDVDDTRMSPGLERALALQGQPDAQLAADGGRGQTADTDVRIHDPHVDDSTLDLQTLEDATTDAEALVIATDHSVFEDLPASAIKQRMDGSILVDTKNVVDRTRWTDRGFPLRHI